MSIIAGNGNNGDIINILNSGDIIYWNLNGGTNNVITFPASIQNTNITGVLNVNITTVLTFSTSDYFIMTTSNITVNGNENTISLPNGYASMFENDSTSGGGPYNIIIENINTSSGSFAESNAGLICIGTAYGQGTTGCQINNCNILSGFVNTGGIMSTNYITISNCSMYNHITVNTGPIGVICN